MKAEMKQEDIDDLKLIVIALRGHQYPNKRMGELADKFQAVIDKWESRKEKIERRNEKWH